jgi:hypothetical protein
MNECFPLESMEYRAKVRIFVLLENFGCAAMNRYTYFIAGVLSLYMMCCFVIPVKAATYYVSANGNGQYPFTNWVTASPSIPPAVSIASDGDQVVVSNGLYLLSETIVLTNGILLTSVNGAEHTTIDGQGSNRCLFLSHSNAQVQGFTIARGYAHRGAGVYITNGGVVASCVIKNNETMSGNSSTSGIGGGVFCTISGVVADSLITGNTSVYNGAAVALRSGGLITHCTITDNLVTSPMFEYAPQVSACHVFAGGEIAHCRIVGNRGGGLTSYAGVTIKSCVVTDNQGDGLYLDYGNGHARNTLIARNAGRGVYAFGNSDYENCTITGNSNYNMYLRGGGHLVNCIVYPNSIYYECGSSDCIIYEHSLVGGNPGFRDGPKGDYRLRPDSICRDAGTNVEWMAGGFDLDGTPRIINGACDQGPYEYQGAPDSLRVTDGGVQCGWNVVTGETYQIEAISHLTDETWDHITGVVTAETSVLTSSDPMTSNHRFYRAVFRP